MKSHFRRTMVPQMGEEEEDDDGVDDDDEVEGIGVVQKGTFLYP